MPVPSPCTNVCAIDPLTGWCAGCMRTIDEIAAWGALDEAGKRAIWKSLPARRAEFGHRDGGESAATHARLAASDGTTA